MLWAVFTLIAAAAQTARNAMQRELTATLGTVGATHVRFLFGFPFALLFLAGVTIALGESLPRPPAMFWPWVLAGAFTQIAATATMLSVMGQRSFVVSYAFIKTEPIHVALFGLIFLGDKVTALSAAAILTLHLQDFVLAATFTVSVGLVIQAGALSLYLWLRDRKVLSDIMRAWRPSLFAGFMGAFASEFWFLGFAITSAANVRTLALVEVLFAQGVTHFVFKQPTTARERAGVVLVVIGVALLVWAY